MSRSAYLYLIFLASAWTAYVFLMAKGVIFDDAYIHFRIADNFSKYGLPFYNINDPVMGTSSPIWTWTLSFLSFLGLNLSPAVLALNGIFVVAGALAWTHCLRQLSSVQPAPWIQSIFFFAYIGVLTSSGLGLMETPLALLLLGLSVIAIIRNKKIGWILLALAAFVRLELLVIATLIIFVLALSQDRRCLLIGIPAFLMSLILLALATWVSFNAIIPQTVTAKQIVYEMSRSQVLSHISSKILPLNQNLPNVFTSLAIFFLAGWSFGRARISELLSDKKKLLVLGIGAGGAVIAFAYVLKAVFAHEWYLPLIIVPVIFLAAAWPETGAAKNVLFLIVVAAPLNALALYTVGAIHAEYLPGKEVGARVQRYLEVGSMLYQHFPDARLMTSEIGGLGASFKGEILDGVGLVTSAALAYHPMKVGTQRSGGGIGAIPAGFVEQELPELIVSYPVFVEEFEKSETRQKYQRIQVPAFSYPTEDRIKSNAIWGNKELYIYIRDDIATSDSILIGDIERSLTGERALK